MPIPLQMPFSNPINLSQMPMKSTGYQVSDSSSNAYQIPIMHNYYSQWPSYPQNPTT